MRAIAERPPLVAADWPLRDPLDDCGALPPLLSVLRFAVLRFDAARLDPLRPFVLRPDELRPDELRPEELLRLEVLRLDALRLVLPRLAAAVRPLELRLAVLCPLDSFPDEFAF